jgi:DNA ligase-associated metallophosphoesterase
VTTPVLADAARAIVAGEELMLLAERVAWWAARATLLVADPHFGKAATFRSAGVYVPHGTTSGALQRLDALVTATGTRRIVFLGDFLHATEGRSDAMFRELASWRRSHASIEMMLVRGNHDVRAGDPPHDLDLRVVDGPYGDGPFAFAHHPVSFAGHYVLAGHLHPCITVRGPARQHERLPCFWFGRETGVLPAFGEFTGWGEVEPRAEDRIWLVAGNEVVRGNGKSYAPGRMSP